MQKKHSWLGTGEKVFIKPLFKESNRILINISGGGGGGGTPGGGGGGGGQPKGGGQSTKQGLMLRMKIKKSKGRNILTSVQRLKLVVYVLIVLLF